MLNCCDLIVDAIIILTLCDYDKFVPAHAEYWTVLENITNNLAGVPEVPIPGLVAVQVVYLL